MDRKTKGSTTEFYQSVGRRLRELRLSHKMSMEKVAENINVSHQQLQKYEAGLNRVPLATLAILSELFGVDVTFFAAQRVSDKIETEKYNEVAHAAVLLAGMPNKIVATRIRSLIKAINDNCPADEDISA